MKITTAKGLYPIVEIRSINMTTTDVSPALVVIRGHASFRPIAPGFDMSTKRRSALDPHGRRSGIVTDKCVTP